MFTHWSPMRSMCLIDVQQRRDEPQIAGDRRLQREQREDALVDLQVAAVDRSSSAMTICGELDVLVLERLHRAVELVDDQVKAAEASVRSSSAP